MHHFALLPDFDGTFHSDPAKLEKFQTDFGKIVQTAPVGVLHPANAADVVKMVRYCLENNLKVIPRGMSHSAFGQCQCDGGVVINMPALGAILDENFSGEAKWIDVAGGTLWHKLIRYAGERGLGPVVTTDWQFLSVGGTLSTGGVGFMSHKHGIQADHVLEMDVVTGRGELITCSATRNADLFDAVRGGVGQFGIATRVRIPLVPTPKRLDVYQFFCTAGTDFHAGIGEAARSGYFDCIHAFVVPNEPGSIARKLGPAAGEHRAFVASLAARPEKWIYFTELVKYDGGDGAWQAAGTELAPFRPFGEQVFQSTDTFYDYITKEPPLIVTEKEKGKTSHPELTLAHPASSFVAFMDRFLDGLAPEDMAEGPILIIPVGGTRLTTPLFKVPAEAQLYFIGILRNAYPDTPERVGELTARNLACYAHSLALGGNRYLCDSLPLPDSPSTWRNHYGPALWEVAARAKRKYDPQHLFVSNLNIFGALRQAVQVYEDYSQ